MDLAYVLVVAVLACAPPATKQVGGGYGPSRRCHDAGLVGTGAALGVRLKAPAGYLLAFAAGLAAVTILVVRRHDLVG